MKKLIFAMAIGVLVLTGCASTNAGKSADNKIVIDGKNIEITDASEGWGSDHLTLNKDDLANGIYIEAFSAGTYYPNATAAIRERFTSKGIKIVDKIEDANIGIFFDVSISLTMASADKAAAYSMLPTTEQAIVNGNALVNGMAVAGPGALLGFAVGAMFPVDSKAFISGIIAKKPQKYQGIFVTQVKSPVKDGLSTNFMVVKYKLEKNKEASDDIVLKMAVDQWMKKYIVFEQPVANNN